VDDRAVDGSRANEPAFLLAAERFVLQPAARTTVGEAAGAGGVNRAGGGGRRRGRFYRYQDHRYRVFDSFIQRKDS